MHSHKSHQFAQIVLHDEYRTKTKNLKLADADRKKLIVRGYEVSEYLGSGNYGHVYRATYGKLTTRAVKTMDITAMDWGAKFFLEKALELLQLLKRIRHPFMVQVWDIFITSQKQLLIFMELAEGGDLKQYRKEKKACFEEAQVCNYFFQFGSAFKFLHNLEFANRDIKPANILLNKARNMCKVADFGFSSICFSKCTGRQKLSGSLCGSDIYMAPEVVKGFWTSYDSYDAFAADVWSTGVMLFEMLNNAYPFLMRFSLDKTGNKLWDYKGLYERQMIGKFKFTNVKLTSECCGVIVACLDPEPTRRPTFNQLILD